MIKWIRSWNEMYKKIGELKGKQLIAPILVILIFGILIALPYIIVFYNMAYIYSAVMWPIHLIIWLIPVYGNLCMALHAKIVYDATSEAIPELPKRSNVILGGLFNPYTLGCFLVASVCLEILF